MVLNHRCCTVCGQSQLNIAVFQPLDVESSFSQTREALRTRWGGYAKGSVPWHLFQILEEFLDGRVLPPGRGKKLNRTVISEEIGVTKSALTPFILMLSDYENFLRIAPSNVAKIPAMKKWLAENFEKGALETFNESQISRKPFFDAFGITGVTLIRHPEIAELFAPYDERVSDGSYIPGYQRAMMAILLEKCSGSEFIGPDGRKFRWEKAAELLATSTGILKRPPYRQVIERILEEYRTSVQENPLVATMVRDFSFEYLSELGWEEEVGARIVAHFKSSFKSSSESWLGSVYIALNNFLKWLSTHSAEHVQHCSRLIKIGKVLGVPNNLWNVSHRDYGEDIRRRYPNVGSRNSRFKCANAVLEMLVEAGIIPEISLPFRNDRASEQKNLPTLFEALPKSAGPVSRLSNADQYLAFVKQKFAEAAARGIEIDATDEGVFLENLRTEIETENVEPGRSPDEVISTLMQRRLDLIEGECTRRLDRSRELFEYGQSLLKKGVPPGTYWDLLFGPDVKRQNTSAILRAYFPDLVEGDQGLANLLVFVADRYQSVYPRSNKINLLEGAFFQKRALRYGGLPLLQAYLMPNMDAVGSTLTLYLCASGSNVTVGRTLFADCVEPSQVPRHSAVTGFKARAEGKPINGELLTTSAAVKGMNWLGEALVGFRKMLPVDDRNLLFVVRLQGTIKILNEWSYREFFKEVVAAIPELSHLNLTPNMLRPTVLLLSAINGDGSTRTSLAIGQHGIQVNQGYTNKFPVMLQRDKDIRDFVDHFETVTIAGNEKVLGLIGLKDHELETRLKRATKTGFGILCGDRHGKPENNGAICRELDCWNGCPQIIVLARKEDIALLVLWQRSLRALEGEWVRDRPERWLQVWLPWLIFADTVEAKLRGRYERVWIEAVALADRMAAQPAYRPYRIS
jgi:hypothetical protein